MLTVIKDMPHLHPTRVHMAHLFRPTKAIGTMIKNTVEWSHLDLAILCIMPKDTMGYQTPLLYGVDVLVLRYMNNLILLQLHIILTIGLILSMKVESTLHMDITHSRLGCIRMVDMCTLHMDLFGMWSNHPLFQLVGLNSTSRENITPI